VDHVGGGGDGPSASGSGSGGGGFSWFASLLGGDGGGSVAGAQAVTAVRGLYMYGGVGCGKTMLMATLFFIGSVMLVPLLPQGFIPPDDNSQTQVYVELPPGSTLAQTQSSAEHARQLLMQVEDVKSIYTTIGGGSAGTDPFAGTGAAEVRKATLTIQLTERGKRPNKQQVENRIRAALQQLPGVRTKVGLGGSGEKYVLVLTGEDPQALQSSINSEDWCRRVCQRCSSMAVCTALCLECSDSTDC
jgi:hypothetical protein